MHTYLTVIGNLTNDPSRRETKDGVQIAEFGLAHNHRKKDPETGLWENTEPTFYTVTCWRRVAEGVLRSLHKGDPVVVVGKFTTREFARSDGQLRSQLRLEAEAVGPDLQWVVAAVSRRSANPVPQSPVDGAATRALAPVPDRDPDDDFEPVPEDEPAFADALPGGSD